MSVVYALCVCVSPGRGSGGSLSFVKSFVSWCRELRCARQWRLSVCLVEWMVQLYMYHGTKPERLHAWLGILSQRSSSPCFIAFCQFAIIRVTHPRSSPQLWRSVRGMARQRLRPAAGGGAAAVAWLTRTVPQPEEPLTAQYPVLAAGGGFVRGKIVSVAADGLVAVVLGGGNRLAWVSISEIAVAIATHAGAGFAHSTAQVLAANVVAAILPAVAESNGTRWVAACRCMSDTPIHGTQVQRFQPIADRHALIRVELSRIDGRFGMGHDEENRVAVVHPGSAAEQGGLRVGDVVHAVDGIPLKGLLSAALTGKERVELSISPIETVLARQEPDSRVAKREHVLLRALGPSSAMSPHPLNVADECFVLAGGWQEATPVHWDDGCYLLSDDRSGMRWWASSGEVAPIGEGRWRHAAIAGRHMLAWHPHLGSYRRMEVMGHEASRPGDLWRVRFDDDGFESVVPRREMRERMATPLRVLVSRGKYLLARYVPCSGPRIHCPIHT